MAVKHYAWTTIQSSKGTIPAGTVVTAKEIGDDWPSLLKCGAVRTKVYPKMPETWQGSVRSFRMEQIRAIRAGLDARDLLADSDEVSDEETDEYLELLATVEEGASG